MRFLDVQIGQVFDFERSGFLRCLKISPRKYLYECSGEYYETQVGTVKVLVSNVRDAYGWEIEHMTGQPKIQS